MQRTRNRILASALVVVGVATSAVTLLSVGDAAPAQRGSSKTIVVGVSGAFAENQLVAEMYAQVLERAEYSVERQFDFPSREVSENALESGQIDVKPEYLSSLLLFLDENAEASSHPATVAAKDRRLLRPAGISVLEPSAAQDTNEFVATLDTARHYRLSTLSSLAPVASQLTIGASPECPQRPYCLPGLKRVYGIVFYDYVPLDVGGPKTVAALKDGSVDTGLLFSTDPSIRRNGFVPLVDDKHLQNAENITPVIRSEKLNGEVRRLLDAVSARLTTETITNLVGRVVLDGEPVGAVARSFLTANGLL